LERCVSMKLSRRIFAFLIAPSVAPVIVLALVSIGEPRDLNDVVSIGAIVLLASYSGAVLFGVPVVQILNRYSLLNLGSLALAGIVAGIFVFVIAAMLVVGVDETLANIEVLSVVLGGVIGIAVAMTFGLIAGVQIQAVKRENS
jgi:hypothetical protein